MKSPKNAKRKKTLRGGIYCVYFSMYIYIYIYIYILQCTQYISNETLKVRVYYNYIITACEVVSSNAL